jgi:hypothetical protein
LFDIVVADENPHAVLLFDQAVDMPDSQASRPTGIRRRKAQHGGASLQVCREARTATLFIGAPQLLSD